MLESTISRVFRCGMDRYLQSRRDGAVRMRLISLSRMLSKKPAHGHWTAWPRSRKDQIGAELLQGRSLSGTAALLGVPESTLRGWRRRVEKGNQSGSQTSDSSTSHAGRPPVMTPQEEGKMLQLLTDLRQEGVLVDREVMIKVAQQLIAESRGLPIEDVPDLSTWWAKRCACPTAMMTHRYIRHAPQFPQETWNFKVEVSQH